MTENLFETQYDLTKKSKLRIFYESNKILIYSTILVIIIIIGGYIYYQESKENKKILLSESYIEAKIYLKNNNKEKAANILKEIIFSNEPTYSTLSFFMLLNENLINDGEEISKLFDHLLKNNKFDKEMKNLLLYKRALYKSNYVEESILLEETKSLLDSTDESVWKAHVLLLLGDFYFSRSENIKAIDFYNQILSIKNLQTDLYDQAKSKITLIANE